MAVLITISDVGLGRRYRLSGDAVIGRHAACDIQLVDAEISKQHARIAAVGAGFAIEDLGSRNGVLVNGVRIQSPTTLAPNDVIAIGGRVLLYEPDFDVLPEADGDHAVLLTPDQPTRDVRSRPAPAAVPPEDSLAQDLLAVVASTASGGGIVPALMARLKQSLPHAAASVLWLEGDEAEPVFVDSRARAVALSRPLLKEVLRERQGVLLTDEPGAGPVAARALCGERPRSLLLVPLVLAGVARGVIFLADERPRTFTDADLAALTRAAPVVALAVSVGRRLAALERRLVAPPAAGGETLVGASPAMRKLEELIDRAAAAATTALVVGETGSGKELVARALHDRSAQRGGPFVAINCAAIPETLLESELFGHERGAFSGADKQVPGKLELADEGTLFLDEIGELPLVLQAKLLRVLDDKSFYRVGGVRPVRVKFRLVAATHRDLAAMVKAQRFREDLYYRLDVLRLDVPPLRARRDEIPALARHFAARFAAELGRPALAIDDDALAVLAQHAWPGNVRELRNVVERAVVLGGGGRLGVADLPGELAASAPATGAGGPDDAPARSLADEVAALERRRIRDALVKARGKKVVAARALGISRPTLDKKIAEYQIDLFGDASQS